MTSGKEETNALVVFQGRSIRRIWFENKWFFSVVDIIGALTDSINPRDYWYRLKQREKESSGVELSTICRQLKLPAEDGKMRQTDCAKTEGVFRIIQSIPSKNAEPFKRWLAKVGYERIQEIDDPLPVILSERWALMKKHHKKSGNKRSGTGTVSRYC